LQPCSLVSEGLVGATLPGTVTGVRELAADDFLSPPVGGFVACAYETNSRYGELTMVVEPMERNQYEARYVERDPANTRKVPNVGEAAGFSGCGSLSAYSNQRVLLINIQFADCDALHQLLSLARVALRRL
jgi:hypothetical protein